MRTRAALLVHGLEAGFLQRHPVEVLQGPLDVAHLQIELAPVESRLDESRFRGRLENGGKVGQRLVVLFLPPESHAAEKPGRARLRAQGRRPVQVAERFAILLLLDVGQTGAL